MKRTLLTAAIALAASAGALAAPTFGLKNLPSGWDGSFEIKFQNMEAFT